MTKYIAINEYKEYPLTLLRDADIEINHLPKKTYITRGESISFECVGLFVFRNVSLIIYPKNYSIPVDQKNIYDSTVYLVKSILNYNIRYKITDISSDFNAGNIQNNSYISSMFYLIDYYLENGLLTMTTQKYKKNINKNIDWKTTIKRILPMYSDGEFHYYEYYSKTKKKSDSHYLTLLFKLSLQLSIERIGFLYNIYDYTEVYKTDLYKEILSEKDKYIYLLNQTIYETFNDELIYLLNSIKSILFVNSDDQLLRNNLSLFTRNYELIWQDVVSFCFNNELSQYFQRFPTLNIIYKQKIEKRKQIPDVLYKTITNAWYIIDAKYYDIDEHRPGKSDFLKQFFYDISFLSTDNSIHNVLVFNYNADTLLVYLGTANLSDTSNIDLLDKTIHLIGLDQATALKHYSRNDYAHVLYRNSLENELSNNQSSFD